MSTLDLVSDTRVASRTGPELAAGLETADGRPAATSGSRDGGEGAAATRENWKNRFSFTGNNPVANVVSGLAVVVPQNVVTDL